MGIFSLQTSFGRECFNDDIGLVVVFSGCKKALNNNPCKNCHNSFLWKFMKSNFTIQDIKQKLSKFNYDCLILLGGEPLDQPLDLLNQILFLGKNYTKYTFLWTGYTLDEIKYDFYNEDYKIKLWNFVDYVKVGRYIPELKIENSKLASSNQKVYKIINGDFKKEINF